MSKGKYNYVPFKKLISSKAWKLTSELVRRLSKGICYTCERKYKWNELHAGHFIEKQGHAAIYFDLNGLRGQCYRCNRPLHGNLDVYGQKLRKEIGEKAVEELYKKSRKTKVWTKEELNEIAEKIQKLINELND